MGSRSDLYQARAVLSRQNHRLSSLLRSDYGLGIMRIDVHWSDQTLEDSLRNEEVSLYGGSTVSIVSPD